MIRRVLAALALPWLLAACSAPMPPAVLPPSATTKAATAPYLTPYCTATLGTPDCWRNPQVFPNEPQELADVPHGRMPNAGLWRQITNPTR